MNRLTKGIPSATRMKCCQLNGIGVKEVIYEDHSAKTFNRPAWNLMLKKIKKDRKRAPDLILFTKWDRFSRNAGDAYQMIGLLRSFGIELQAIEQPLDLSIPENKMMMAFYLAAPEVENDRRALNIFHGIRRAKKEGRWTSSAPVGYANKTTEDGRKYIAVKVPLASIMKSAFEEIATGRYAVEQVWRQAKNKGLVILAFLQISDGIESTMKYLCPLFIFMAICFLSSSVKENNFLLL